jgi:hypothetical protein
MDDLGARRARRWWQAGRPIGSIGRAAAFVDDVGFALLFPTAEAALPSLYEAASEQPLPLSEMVWGPDAQRVWAWKDELPTKGLAWSGRLLRGGRASFLAPGLLADWWPPTASWPAPSAGRRQLPAPRWRTWWSAARRCWRQAHTGPR